MRILNHPNILESDIITIPLYPTGVWPDAKPFKIKVFEDNTGSASKPSYDADTHSLLLPLPKAVRAELRLSMRLSKEWLSVLGVWNWLSSEHKSKLERMALMGQHWMLTPWRTLEAVHAVRRPLISRGYRKSKYTAVMLNLGKTRICSYLQYQKYLTGLTCYLNGMCQWMTHQERNPR